jgi:hypothetical protein
VIKLVRTQAFKAPSMTMPASVKDKIAKIALIGILKNIKEQKQADGSELKQNPQGYARAKRARGETWRGAVLALVKSEHRFTRPDLWSSKWSGSGLNLRLTVEPTSREDTKRISLAVQQRGYVGWFAPDKDSIQAIRQVLRDWIRAQLRSVARRG